MEERFYNVWVIVRPAPDLPGEWVAHCLDFDVVSQGDSIEHALRMVHEATVMVALDDLNNGRDPGARRAPEDFFGELYAIAERGQKLTPKEIHDAAVEHRLVAVAVPFSLRFEREASSDDVVSRSMRPFPMAIAQQQVAC